MTGAERFVTALRRAQPDRVPVFDQLYHRKLYRHVLGHEPAQFSSSLSAELAHKLGLDASLLIYQAYPAFNTRDSSNQWKSEWGVSYSREESGWPTGYGTSYEVTSTAALTKFTPPSPDAAWRWDHASRTAAFLRAAGLGVVGAIRGPFAMLNWHFLGMERTMVALLTDAEFIKQAVNVYADHAVGIVSAWASCGADALFMTEDLGSSHGPLISPLHYEQFFLSPLSRMVEEAKSKGIEVILHSDGMVLPFFELFAQAHVSAVHPVERRAGMSLLRCKEHWGQTFAFCGNMDAKGVLLSGTPQEVREETRRTIAEGSPGGGYVFATDHSISDGPAVENVLAMIQEARRTV